MPLAVTKYVCSFREIMLEYGHNIYSATHMMEDVNPPYRVFILTKMLFASRELEDFYHQW